LQSVPQLPDGHPSTASKADVERPALKCREWDGPAVLPPRRTRRNGRAPPIQYRLPTLVAIDARDGGESAGRSRVRPKRLHIDKSGCTTSTEADQATPRRSRSGSAHERVRGVWSNVKVAPHTIQYRNPPPLLLNFDAGSLTAHDG